MNLENNDIEMLCRSKGWGECWFVEILTRNGWRIYEREPVIYKKRIVARWWAREASLHYEEARSMRFHLP